MTADLQVLTESVRIPVTGGAPMGGYLARPAGSDPHPAVLVGMGLFGVSAHVRDVCADSPNLATSPWPPDLYHRSDPGIESFPPTTTAEATVSSSWSNSPDRLRSTTSAPPPSPSMRVAAPGRHGRAQGWRAPRLPRGHPFHPGCCGRGLRRMDPHYRHPAQPEPTIAATPAITGKVLFLVARTTPSCRLSTAVRSPGPSRTPTSTTS